MISIFIGLIYSDTHEVYRIILINHIKTLSKVTKFGNRLWTLGDILYLMNSTLKSSVLHPLQASTGITCNPIDKTHYIYHFRDWRLKHSEIQSLISCFAVWMIFSKPLKVIKFLIIHFLFVLVTERRRTWAKVRMLTTMNVIVGFIWGSNLGLGPKFGLVEDPSHSPSYHLGLVLLFQQLLLEIRFLFSLFMLYGSNLIQFNWVWISDRFKWIEFKLNKFQLEPFC